MDFQIRGYINTKNSLSIDDWKSIGDYKSLISAIKEIAYVRTTLRMGWCSSHLRAFPGNFLIQKHIRNITCEQSACMIRRNTIIDLKQQQHSTKCSNNLWT